MVIEKGGKRVLLIVGIWGSQCVSSFAFECIFRLEWVDIFCVAIILQGVCSVLRKGWWTYEWWVDD